MLNKGDTIPDISLEDQNGKMVSLYDLKNKNLLVIYFYPKDNTYLCTTQACSFRDNYEAFQKAGAEVIGISRDSVESHKKVTNKRKLPFILLSDTEKKALKAFKIPSALLGFFSSRVTFVVDKRGTIVYTFKSDFSADKHIKESLKVLKSL